MIIAFMGNDGSGKTTISKEVHTFFQQLGFDVSYKHEYEYTFLRFLFRMVGKKKIEQSRNEMLVENKKSIKYTLWPLLVWGDLLLQYCSYKLSKRNKIILLDRYPYDHYQSFKYLGTLNRVTKWLFLHFPKPDVYLLLIVDPKIAYERKKATHTYSIEFYTEQTSSYRNLAQKLSIPVIDTSGDLQKTLSAVILSILKHKKFARQVIRKGIQNRILFHLIMKYNLDADIFGQLWKSCYQRRDKCTKTLATLNKLLDDSHIAKCSLIKTFDYYSFYGNDIDVILPPSDFKRLLDFATANTALYGLNVVYRVKKDAGKADVIVKEGLNIDMHSYVGWENMAFINFDQLDASITTENMFGMDVKTVDAKTNSIIVGMHIFEKGYVTAEEFLFLRQNLDISMMRERLPSLTVQLADFLIELDEMMAKPPREFPAFISMASLISGYSNILTSSHVPGKAGKLFTMFALQMFWRIRYALKKKLPFDIAY